MLQRDPSEIKLTQDDLADYLSRAKQKEQDDKTTNQQPLAQTAAPLSMLTSQTTQQTRRARIGIGGQGQQ